MKFLVLILAVVATAYAQSKCSTTPETWFGYFREVHDACCRQQHAWHTHPAAIIPNSFQRMMIII